MRTQEHSRSKNGRWSTVAVSMALGIIIGCCIGYFGRPTHFTILQATVDRVLLYASLHMTIRVDAYPMHLRGVERASREQLIVAGVFENNIPTLLSDDWPVSPKTTLGASEHETYYVASFPAGTTNRAAIAWAEDHGFRHGTHHELIQLALSKNVLRFDPNPEWNEETRLGWSTAWINAIGDYEGTPESSWGIASLDPHEHESGCVADCSTGADINLMGTHDGVDTFLDFSWRLNEQFLLIKKSAKQ